MPRVVVEFDCKKPGCGGTVEAELYVSDPNYNVERMSDGDAIEDHDVACAECETDYEVETVNGMGGLQASVDGEDISIERQYEPEFDEYDDFLLRYEPANDTVGAYENARSQLLALIAIHGSDPTNILNRMVYSQFIAAMEAYLSDKILRLTTDVSDIRSRVIRNAGFLQDQTLKLTEVLLDPAKAESTFKIGLQKILYHDLDKVEKLYQVALQGSFYPDNSTIKIELEKAIKVRHDCVHRNGADTNGVIHSFDDVAIRALADNVSALVDHLELQVEKAIERVSGNPS